MKKSSHYRTVALAISRFVPANWKYELYQTWVTPGFRGEVVENCALLGYHTTYYGNYLPTFRDNLSVPFSRASSFLLENGAEWLSRTFGKDLPVHSTRGYSPFFLLHGREIVTPANKNPRAKTPKATQGPEQQVVSLKARLRQAYMAVNKANRKSHMANKKRYDRRPKHHSFNVGDHVYLYNPARKLGMSK